MADFFCFWHRVSPSQKSAFFQGSVKAFLFTLFPHHLVEPSPLHPRTYFPHENLFEIVFVFIKSFFRRFYKHINFLSHIKFTYYNKTLISVGHTHLFAIGDTWHLLTQHTPPHPTIFWTHAHCFPYPINRIDEKETGPGERNRVLYICQRDRSHKNRKRKWVKWISSDM